MGQKIKAKKSLGQHFLNNNYYLYRIVSASSKKMFDVKHIIEIGPGTGLLTSLLLETGKNILCIEKDSSLYELLINKFGDNDNFQIINDDALEVNWSALKKDNAILIANLPYNVSVPLIINYLENTDLFMQYCVLIQKEVAQRLAAKPNTKDYGRLAALAQVYCDVKIHFDIPGTAFSPRTKVTSSFITLTPKENVTVHFPTLSNMLQAVFNHRRKMVRSTIGKTHQEIYEALLEEGVKPEARPEDITVSQFIACTNKLYDKNKNED